MLKQTSAIWKYYPQNCIQFTLIRYPTCLSVENYAICTDPVEFFPFFNETHSWGMNARKPKAKGGRAFGPIRPDRCLKAINQPFSETGRSLNGLDKEVARL